jgi:tripeptide aminopeptidase
MERTLLQKILEKAIAIQQIPAPTLFEGQRSAYLLSQFEAEGLSDVQADVLGNVYGRLPGRKSLLPVIISAHIDTVFPDGTNLEVSFKEGKINGPGIGDNSLGVAGLFGLLWALRQRRISLPDDLWLVANVGEEGLGDLCGMRAVVDRFGTGARAYIILEGMALGQVYHRGLGVRRYRITARTEGGHSWVDYGRPSAIHELAALVARLSALTLPRNPRTSLNVGIISGGTSVNTIAPQASIELDLRSESERTLKSLVDQVLNQVRMANRSGVEFQAELIGDRPVGKIAAEHPLIKLAIQCLQEQGLQPNLSIGSTDANIPLSRKLPAVCIGLTTGRGAHTAHESILTEPLASGMVQLVSLVEGVYSI